MTDLRKAAEDLLEGVEGAIEAGVWKVDGACHPDSAIVRLRQALAQPVDAVNMSQERVDETSKRKREWVGLTDKEIIKIANMYHANKLGTVGSAFRAVEAKLKEKNT